MTHAVQVGNRYQIPSLFIYSTPYHATTEQHTADDNDEAYFTAKSYIPNSHVDEEGRYLCVYIPLRITNCIFHIIYTYTLHMKRKNIL